MTAARVLSKRMRGIAQLLSKGLDKAGLRLLLDHETCGHT